MTYPSESKKLINYRDFGKITGSVAAIRVKSCWNKFLKNSLPLVNEGAMMKGLNKLQYVAHNPRMYSMIECWMWLYRRASYKI